MPGNVINALPVDLHLGHMNAIGGCILRNTIRLIYQLVVIYVARPVRDLHGSA